LEEHPTWGAGINATIGKETLEEILEKHPRRLHDATRLLDPDVLQKAREDYERRRAS
jgi:hypothetical protein